MRTNIERAFPGCRAQSRTDPPKSDNARDGACGGADVELLRRLLVEDHPLIQGYDQVAYAAALNYNRRDIAPSLEAFRAARATAAQLFEFMSDEDWHREGTHSESGNRISRDR